MDSPPKLDVDDWQDSPLPFVPKARPYRGFLPPTLIGILGTLLLHAMLIQSVSFVSRGPKPKPPEAQESANGFSKSTADVHNLILISLPMIGNPTQSVSQSAISSLPDLSKMKIKAPISADPPEFLNLEILALSEDEASKPIASGADSAEQARLFGIYTGQIQARIDRVWRRPRTPVSENSGGQKPTDAGGSFQCEAQIIQDLSGNVQEILLPRCNGSAAWQSSLVLAIQQASPLPAPPELKVFSQTVTLRFVGLPYAQGSSSEEYELVPLARIDQ
jgi:hypothetical protein